MTPSHALDPLERRLLATATGLAGVRRIEELVARLRPALLPAAGPSETTAKRAPTVAGLALYDEERRLVAQHLIGAASAQIGVVNVPVASSVHRPEACERRCFVHTLSDAPEDDFQRALAAAGVGTVLRAPLFFDVRPLGALFLGLPGPEPAAAELCAYLVELAKIVEPHVWSCFTDERFSRGDRRRDALRELSRVINTSLDTRLVLHLARVAIGSIEGHRASWIGLLEPGGSLWRRYDRPAEYLDGVGEPVLERVEGSVLAELTATGRTHESEDLVQRPAFHGDEELRARGVRRYVATPLATGGKLLGALLFGTDDPHPALRMDVWLLENIAVQIALAIDNALHYEEIQRLSARREQQNVYLREEIKSEHEAGGMLGRSAAMQRVRNDIARVAETESTVLISGPTGVGKELVARAIHEASRRKDQPMVKLNCAAIPEGMVESELFGHERGAFTSAVDRRIGRFELAHNGTLFLDEIGELPLAVQAKLLRVLQSGEFERVGGTKTLTSNARIIAATNRDLSRALASGAFRSDLFYRLNVFPIEVPSLAERREDVPLLAQAFLEQFERRMGKHLLGIEPATLARLYARAWPGNVRELKHVIERAVILCDGWLEVPDEPVTAPGELSAPTRHMPAPAQIPTLDELEEAHIRSALRLTGGVVEGPRGAAALLGIKSSTLRFRMKRKGIRRPENGAG